MLPSSLYIQQLKERLGNDRCNVLAKLFYPSQLTGAYVHPTAPSTSQWTISNMNTFETNRTDWNTTVASQIYRGDPWTGTADCLLPIGTTSSVATTASSSAPTSSSSATATSLTSSTALSTSYPTSSSGEESKKRNYTTTIILSVVLPVVALLAIGAVLAFIIAKRRKNKWIVS